MSISNSDFGGIFGEIESTERNDNPNDSGVKRVGERDNEDRILVVPYLYDSAQS